MARKLVACHGAVIDSSSLVEVRHFSMPVLIFDEAGECVDAVAGVEMACHLA